MLKSLQTMVRKPGAPSTSLQAPVDQEDGLAFKGYTESQSSLPSIEALSDEDLQALNRTVAWQSFVVDSKGRRFGNFCQSGKATRPEVIPDRRLLLLNERFNLADKQVLELGCFEGVHTAGLAAMARNVVALDARIENVAKTVMRCHLLGAKADVFQYNVEVRPLPFNRMMSDIVCSLSVLHYLGHPMLNLLEMGILARQGLILDTYYAQDKEATEEIEEGGRTFKVFKKMFTSGMPYDSSQGLKPTATWLTLDTIVEALKRTGFDQVEILENRKKSEWSRALIMAEKTIPGVGPQEVKPQEI